MNPIDLNADVAEGTGLEPLLAPLCTSWNVCCGYHAGSEDSIRKTLDLAKKHDLRVGAHPGHPDRAQFGRVAHPISPPSLLGLLDEQVGALKRELTQRGMTPSHLKLHGALYHQAAREEELAQAVAAWAHRHNIPVFGQPDTLLQRACAGKVPFVAEGFADRGVFPDGSLIPRDQPGALLHDPEQAATQALSLAKSGRYRTLCTHGDTADAATLLSRVRQALIQAGHPIAPPTHVQ